MKSHFCRPFGAILAALCATTALSVQILVADAELAASSLAHYLPAYSLSTGDIPHILMYLAKLRQNLPTDFWAWSVCAAALAFLFDQLGSRLSARGGRFNPGLGALGAVFGLMQVFGLSMYALGNWDFVLANGYQTALSLVCMLGYATLFYAAAQGLWLFLRGCPGLCRPAVGKAAALWDSHPQLCASGLILAGWSPWLLCFFPGSVSWDSAFQVQQSFGVEAMSAHHTVLSTWLHGAAYQIGHLLGWDNLGTLLYVALQTAVCAFAFGGIAAFAKKSGCPRGVQLAVTAFFALVPAWGAYAQVVIKDTLFVGLFALFLLGTADLLVFGAEHHARKKLPGYFLVALLCCLLRQNGSYAVLPTLLLMLAAGFRGRPRLYAACGTAAVFACFSLFNWSAANLWHITPGSVGESLSVPLQQTARYVRDYGAEVTPGERSAIDAVLDYEALPGLYKPYLSDPVKDTLRMRAPSSEQLGEYFKAWFAMFLKHPDCYFQSLHANSYGYYTIVNSGIGNLKEQYYCYIKSDYMESAGLDAHYLPGTETARYVLYNYALTFDQIPLLGLLTSRGFGTWLLAALALYLAQKRSRAALTSVPMWILLLTCIASPVDDLLRYYLPVLAGLPLIFCLSAAASGNAPGSKEPAAQPEADLVDKPHAPALQ